MVEKIDDWYIRMVEDLPGQYSLRLCEPNRPGKDSRIIQKSLTISEAMDLHDVGGRALRYIARTFR